MPDEPRKSAPAATGWTVDTLHQHLDRAIGSFRDHVDEKFKEADLRYEQRFKSQNEAVLAAFSAQQAAMQAALAAQEKAVQAALAASDRAVEKAEVNSEKWRENANEWRGAMNDRERTFLSQPEFKQAVMNLETQLADLKASRDQGAGRTTGQQASWALFIAAITIVCVVIAAAGVIYGISRGH